MFETDEVDVDLFTPASSTSLANLFKNNQVEHETDKTSLKYVPEQAPVRTRSEEKLEDPKLTECIFACASYAYEWSHNTYINKGKLGFALMKILKNDTHSVVLYDSNKTTLSCATLTSTFELHVKDNVSISYYDNSQKYWTIYAKGNEIYKVLEILKELNVTLKHSTEQESGPPGKVYKSDQSSKNIKNIDDIKKQREDKANDTDSSMHRKTKDSIIKRMASMGHSVLPSAQVNTESTDSSDSNNSPSLRRLSKQKQGKSKGHTSSENEVLETVNRKESVKKSVLKNRSAYETTCNIYESPDEVITCKSLEIINNIRDERPNIGLNDVSILLSEQRVSNSELRINMNRISDKLDLVIDKLKQTSTNDKNCGTVNYQNMIVQKLLNEYETKIKYYEEYIQVNGLQNKNLHLGSKTNIADATSDCKNILETNEEKDITICQLKDEINKLTQKYDTVAQKEKSYLDEINNLKAEIDCKEEKLLNLNKKIEDTSNDFQKSDDAKNKIKSLMNDTFQSIAANFTNEENYSGAKVKNVVAAVIKKTTIEAISDL